MYVCGKHQGLINRIIVGRLTSQIPHLIYNCSPRKFQEQRRHVVNYEEEENLSWCNKYDELGHIRAFFAAGSFVVFAG